MSRGIGHFSASLNLFTGVAESHVKRRDGRFCYVEKERERERGAGGRKKNIVRASGRRHHRRRGVRVRGI